MFQKLILALVSCIVISLASAVKAGDGNALSGPYLDQSPPGDVPVLFAPGIVSDGLNNRDMAITPDGSVIYFGVNLRNFDLSTIMAVHRVDDKWGKPEARNQPQ